MKWKFGKKKKKDKISLKEIFKQEMEHKDDMEKEEIKVFKTKKYKYFKWTEGRGDNGKECTSTERKIG